jgi:CheY-like chemotaxis protein
LAEDSLDNQRLIAYILRKAGWDVVTADNGEVACERMSAAMERGEAFDLVLMDVQMPVVDGHEATRRLRRMGYQGPIVALTANTLAGDREKCLAAGCDFYVGKPISRESLLSVAASYGPGCRPGSTGVSATALPAPATSQDVGQPSAAL